MSTAPALPHIVGSVAVRHFRDSDLPALYDIESDAFLKQFIHGGHVIASREDWIAKARGLCNSDFQFALEHVPSAQFMGRGTLGHFTLNNRFGQRTYAFETHMFSDPQPSPAVSTALYKEPALPPCTLPRIYCCSYNYPVRITYDPAKRETTLRERGLDFEDAAIVFAGLTYEVEDTRLDYGEIRLICYGRLGGRMVVLGYTPRGAARHVFSMRKANEREQTRIGAALEV